MQPIHTKLLSSRLAFTMIELVFVIVILGIVASIGSSIIVKVYESYIMQRAVHNASIKTELAINQLANRLSYRIDMSMLARVQGKTGYLNNIDVYRIENVPTGNLDDNMSLEWINYDNDSFATTNPPIWSGFVDLNASSFANINTPGSKLTLLSTILGKTAPGTTPALLFLGENDYSSTQSYNALCLYGGTCVSSFTLAPALASDTDIPLPVSPSRVSGNMYYTEMYQIISTAYAVILTPAPSIDGVNVWDLNLYYNYQPWKGDIYTNGAHATLLKNVSVFRFKHEQNSIRIKLCALEQIGNGAHISTCKEKAVIR